MQEEVYDKFIEMLACAMKEQLRVGSGFDSNTTQGPLINPTAVNKVHRLVEDSAKKGGKIIMGGKRKEILSGNFYEPTLISDVNLDMDLSREEIFGPIVSIMKYDEVISQFIISTNIIITLLKLLSRFKTEEDAIRISNSVSVGLAGYFYSNDISQIWRVAEKLETGMIGINDSIISTIEAPFGGVKGN